MFKTLSKRIARETSAVLICLSAMSSAIAVAGEQSSSPRPVPLTRPEMKQYLEEMKGRTPRIPLPDLSKADKERLGERAASYESRLQYHYLSSGNGERQGRGGLSSTGRDSDPDMTLDYAFKVQLFWIVSRTNNCHYCLGHQEGKLLRAGMSEDEIAALDGDWAVHTPAQQAAYAFARKITYEPHQLNDADIDRLRKHYTDKQILEMILSVAGNNSINRWKEGAGIPQSVGGGGAGGRRGGVENAAEKIERPVAGAHSYVTPTSPKFQNVISRVAPVTFNVKAGKPTTLTICNRPPLESRAIVEQALAAARRRTPRLPLVDDAKAREVVPEGFPTGTLPQWVRLLATFPNSAPGRIAAVRSADERGDLSPLMKAQLSWIIARQDRAWYAVGQARQRLKELGWSDDQVFSLDGDWSGFAAAEKSLFAVARNLAATPVVLTDAEVAEAVKQAGPRDVVQVINYTTTRAAFDRITESAGLQLEQ